MVDPGLREVAEVRPEVCGDVETQYPGRLPLVRGGSPHHHQAVSVLQHAVPGQGEGHAGHVGPGPAVERIVSLHCVNNRNGLGVTSAHIEVTQSTSSRSLESKEVLNLVNIFKS